MPEYAIYCYAWDLADDGVGHAVDEVRRRGLNAMTMAGSYHAGKFLRPRGRSGKVYFPQDGTAYFRTDPARYGEIKPVENTLVAKNDVLASLCERHDIRTNAWMVLLHNSRLGEMHPQATVQNAFGDRYVYSLCPSVPAAREYAVNLCADIARSYPIVGMSIETPGYLPYVHGYHHEFALVRQNRWLDDLLGLCFCNHCRSGAGKAGIDADGLCRRVRLAVDGYLGTDVDHPDDMAEAFWLADVVLDPDLADYLRWRCDTVTSLVTEIRDAVRGDVPISIIPSVARPTGGAWYEGSDLRALAAAAGSVTACFYEPAVSRIMSDLIDIKRRVGDAGGIRAIVRPGYPDLQGRDAVAGAVAALTGAGVADIAFYNYGHLRDASLDWIADAIAALEPR